MKTIIVDDEPWMIYRFTDLCKDVEDIELIEKFDSPYDALEFSAENPVELAFLDIEMPEMTGIQLAERLSQICPGIRIVLVSAYDSTTVNEKKGNLQCGYMRKPYDTETLMKVTQQAMRG